MKGNIVRLSAIFLTVRLHPANILAQLRSRFGELNMATPRGQQNIVVLFGFLMLFLFVGTVALSTAKFEFLSSKTGSSRYVHFDQNDAELICGNHIEKVVGESLLRYYVDDHSSRLDFRQGLWRIYMVADIGALNAYDEVNVHCFVNHYQHSLTHFRQINPAKKTVMSNELKFFSN